MDKIGYILRGGVSCPRCDSKDIVGEGYDSDTPVAQKCHCNYCHLHWIDLLRPVDILNADGGEVAPHLMPLHQILNLRWVHVVVGGCEIQVHGPFEIDKVYPAIHRIIGVVKSNQELETSIDNIYVAYLQPDGRMEMDEVSFENIGVGGPCGIMLNCIECNEAFDDSETDTCKTCSDWHVEGREGNRP